MNGLEKVFDEKLRRTGRTTRMLEKAKKLANEGRAVYVISANENEQKRFAVILGNKNGHPYDNKLGIKIETLGTLGNFDWSTMSLLGAHPNCIVLIDHYVIETKVKQRLSGLEKALNSLND